MIENTVSSFKKSGDKMERSLGSIYTPREFAQFLSNWAIRHSSNKVIDLGCGEGIFVYEAYNRLLELGANSSDAQNQIFGAELDPAAFERFTDTATKNGLHFQNLRNQDFFSESFPEVDVILGNPPYVRRMYLNGIDKVREVTLERNPLINEFNLTRLTDLYVYFLFYALPSLKPDGKLAVIVADTWLNTEYGRELRRYLLENFKIENLICFDRKVFDDAQVKPVIILATKTCQKKTPHETSFIRVKNGLAIQELKLPFQEEQNERDLICFNVQSEELYKRDTWGIYFKAPQIYEEFTSHPKVNPINHIASTRIGLQTLAKDFFILSQEQATAKRIEEKFLAPLASSPRYVNGPCLEVGSPAQFYVFYCSEIKEQLSETFALKYILEGETREVVVRGKTIKVVGFNNKERIKRAHRNPWYNLRTNLLRRGRAEILIPRLAYRSFTIIWNKARFVPGELFIEFIPHSSPLKNVDIEVYLAILSSSISEVIFRINSQVYGGGTYNIAPGRIKNIPMINPHFLDDTQKACLKHAYLEYLNDKNHSRLKIDEVISEILDRPNFTAKNITSILQDLIDIATSSKESQLKPYLE